MDPLTIGLALSQFVPDIIKWITGSEKSFTNADKIVCIAQGITGATGIDMVSILKTSPDMVLKLSQALTDEFKLEVDNEAQVNTSIQVQANSGHVTWRDLVAVSFVFQAMMNYTILPTFGIIAPPIPDALLYTYGGILGVAMGHSIMQLFKK